MNLHALINFLERDKPYTDKITKGKNTLIVDECNILLSETDKHSNLIWIEM